MVDPPAFDYRAKIKEIDDDENLTAADKSTYKRSLADKKYVSEEDPFDLEKYRQAAGIAYDFSKQKMEQAGGQERETIGKGATEQRTSAEQAQQLKEKDEARDYGQAQRAYRY